MMEKVFCPKCKEIHNRSSLEPLTFIYCPACGTHLQRVETVNGVKIQEV